MDRILVVGTSCSGKSTFGRSLSSQFGHAYVDLDELHWGPNWTPKPDPQFRQLIDAAISNPRWVVAGNYGKVRDLLWSRATCIIWLNYSFPTVFGRAIRRSIKRVWNKEELFSGNRESFRRSFLSRKSILLWVITTFRRRRRELNDLRLNTAYRDLHWVECRHPSDARDLLEHLSRATANPAVSSDVPCTSVLSAGRSGGTPVT